MIKLSARIELIQQGLLKWYDFQKGGKALYIGGRKDALAKLLLECPLDMVCAACDETSTSEWQETFAGAFDYIVCVAALEREAEPQRALSAWRRVLKPEGTLLLGVNNRLGLRYFCGDRDPYTNRNFDGVESYRRAYAGQLDQFRGRCYDRAEWRRMLEEAGWSSIWFYSVLSDLQNPNLIYAEDCLPNEDLAARMFPMYHYPDTVFLEEEGLYTGLTANGLFHEMANAYLIECCSKPRHSDVGHVTNSMDRGPERAFMTVIRKSGVVEKRAACPEGRRSLEALARNNADLAARGVGTVEGRLENGIYVMPYVDAETGQLYLKKLIQTDPAAFLREMDRFRNLILQSSEIVTPDAGDGMGATLRRGYVDMVPLNSFHIGDTFQFFDQEFCRENCPANAIVIRMVDAFYGGNAELSRFVPVETLYERYGLTRELERWHRMEQDFAAGLLQKKVLRTYHEVHRRDDEIVYANRQRMNYSEQEYQRRFVDIFQDLDRKKLILFGSGLFAERFLAMYGKAYPVHAIIDNNRAKWGQKIEGVSIQSPELLIRMESGTYKVLVCIKNYLSVARQLEEMGVSDYGIFDAYKSYPRRCAAASRLEAAEDRTLKKYRIGYIAGVFDLFHIGHLNLFRRAKEQCDYLIVGVVSDEGVRKHKRAEPFIPFEERIELVRSCRYVDEAVEIPLHYGGTRDAFQMYQFDCQFSGSDYAEDADWLEAKAFLEKQGAELVFFPYTETTSSSKLKRLIEKELL